MFTWSMPTDSASLNVLIMLGAILAAGIIAGQFFHRIFRLPTLTAWVLTGILVGIFGLRTVSPEVWSISSGPIPRRLRRSSKMWG